MHPPWRDRHGRLVPIKAVVLFLACLPGAVLASQWATGSLGARPVTEVIHGTGLWTVRFLLITLAVTPARASFTWSKIVLVRRMLGLTTLAYALAHITLYAYDEKWRLLHVASEIVSRIYLTIGFTALLGLITLGLTSTDASVRRLGKNWKRLHRLAYVIATLGLVHYFMQSKANVSGAVVMAGLFVWLMLWRLVRPGWQRSPGVLFLLAVGATLGTAAIEASWYGLATRISAERILAANVNPALAPRPSLWVAVVALLVGAAVLAWRYARPAPPIRPSGPANLRRAMMKPSPAAE